MIDYPAHLDAMWQKAIAPREPDAPTVVSTFAGGGGSLTGYLMAGYCDLLAVEWDNNAVATLRANYPDLDIYHGDIAKLTADEVLERTGLQPGQLDILDGSPPCQGFSTAGKRLIDDPRNQLFREYVRLLRGLRPKVFVMENVSGMVKGKMKLVFVEILKELKASGYRVSAKLLNAMYFHVPQSRERMIFIGVRDDLGIEPTHPKAEWRKFGPRLSDVYSPSLVLSSEKFNAIDTHKQRQRAKGNGFSWQEVTQNKPSLAIVKNMMIGGANTRLIRCAEGWRYPTESEIKQIGGYPDRFMFSDRQSMIELIGNSVPPLFMEAIARHIRREILARVEHGN